MKRTALFTAALVVFITGGMSARAQIPAPPPSPEVQMRSPADLDQMLGPIALYPDPLLGEILPAATLPSQLVLADRFLTGGGNPALIDQQPWDDSIKALSRYPTVLKWMDDNLAWTTALGQAFLYQQPDVMDSIQRLRAQAQALGNLQSTAQQNVFTDDGTIEILPANPEEIYLPIYQADVVYYQQPAGIPFITFGIGLPVGIWLGYDFDWHDHHLLVWGHDHPRPPGWWSHPMRQSAAGQSVHATVWQPRLHAAPAVAGFDRGWTSPPPRSTVIEIGGQSRSSAGARSGAYTVYGGESRPGVVERPAPASHSPAASGALMGVQSTRETHESSARGQESRQATVSRPEPVHSEPAHSEPPHSAPAEHSGGGGKR